MQPVVVAVQVVMGGQSQPNNRKKRKAEKWFNKQRQAKFAKSWR